MSQSSNRLELLFDELIDYPIDQRNNACLRMCGDDNELRNELESLLESSDRARGFLSQGVQEEQLPNHRPIDASTLVGERFGSYEIVRALDSGGMGLVLFAKRADGHYEQHVAIKMARFDLTSDNTIERFHTERQLLANLRHTNIAQLLDGGTSAQGQPYLVMEYIDGLPIDVYCQQRNLSVESRLKLMSPVFDAVQYAHKKLIVHCDLKPSNIMVTAAGTPKLLDFGVAKLLDQQVSQASSVHCESAMECIPCTPEFASPEQLNAEPVTTTSDVFSLGVVLYLLLTGQQPYAFQSFKDKKTLRLCQNVEFVPPCEVSATRLARTFARDLDSIVEKSLSTDPQNRYASVDLLANDIKCLLSGRPVSARDASWDYIAGKFIRRHLTGVLLATFAITSLVTGTAISIWQWQIAQYKNDVALSRLQAIRSLTSTIVFELPQTIAALPQSTELRTSLLIRGANYLDSLLQSQANNPELRRDLATAYHELARLQGNPMSLNLGNPDEARRSYEKSLSLRQQLYEQNPLSVELALELATSNAWLGALNAIAFSRLDTARQMTDNCIELLQPYATNPEHRILFRYVSCHTLAAHWSSADNDLQAAERLLVKAEGIFDSLPADHSFILSENGYRERARLHEEWAEIKARKNQFVEALAHEEERIGILLLHVKNSNRQNQLIGYGYHGLAGRLVAAGRLQDAKSAYHRSITHWERLQSDYPADVSGAQSLAILYAELADLYWRMAKKNHNEFALSKRHHQVCDAYSKSLMNIDKLPDTTLVIPRRYSWSPEKMEILMAYENRCGESVANQARVATGYSLH